MRRQYGDDAGGGMEYEEQMISVAALVRRVAVLEEELRNNMLPLAKRVAAVEAELNGNMLGQHSEFLVALEMKTESHACELKDLRFHVQRIREEMDDANFQGKSKVNSKKVSLNAITGAPKPLTPRIDADGFGECRELSELLGEGPTASSASLDAAQRKRDSGRDSFLSASLQQLGDAVEMQLFGQVVQGYNVLRHSVDSFDKMVEDNMCTAENYEWATSWLECCDSGELDIYTCLGLSNACTLSKDTKRTLLKVTFVVVLQLLVPIMLLGMEVVEGVSFKPRSSTWTFRVMGGFLFLYAVYSMYKNAMDLCRSRLLTFLLQNRADTGYWWPLVMGEFLNVFVSLILVVTLFVVFTEVRSPVNLILNAVAVNFLGDVDAELVDEDMLVDAKHNFKRIFLEYGQDLNNPEKEEKRALSAMSAVLEFLLWMIVVSGVIFAIIFTFAPGRITHDSNLYA